MLVHHRRLEDIYIHRRWFDSEQKKASIKLHDYLFNLLTVFSIVTNANVTYFNGEDHHVPMVAEDRNHQKVS